MRCSTGAARRCRYCHFPSRPNTEYPDKTEPRAHLFYFLNFGYNHGRDYSKLKDAKTGKVPFSRDVTWHHSEAPLILPAAAVGNPPAAPPEDIHVPMPTPVPIVAEPAPAPAPAPALAPTQAPAPTPVRAHTPTFASTTPPPPTISKPPAPVSPCVGHELQHEGHKKMPGQTCHQTPSRREALRAHAPRHGLLSKMGHTALVSMLASRESIDEAIRNHSPSKDSPDRPTAHPSDLRTPTCVSEMEASPRAEI